MQRITALLIIVFGLTAVVCPQSGMVLDSFGARGVTSTVANQTQFSFAASAYDVLAAWQVLSVHPEIDASRILWEFFERYRLPRG